MELGKNVGVNEAYEIILNLKMTVGIGDNGGGEFIGIEKRADGETRVILIPFIDLDKNITLKLVARLPIF